MDSMLMPMLNTLGYALPELIATGVVLGMFWSAARPGAPRSLGLVGAGLMFGAALLQLGLGLYQQWAMLSFFSKDYDQVRSFYAWFGALRLLVNCISLVGLVLIASGLCKATRQAPPRSLLISHASRAC